MLRSLEQERAKKAWEFIAEVKGKKFEKDYRSYVRRAPELILSNGLGNVLAFWRSKGNKNAYSELYKHINKSFVERHLVEDDILQWVIKETTSSLDVFKETKEIIALLNWMKKFAEAELRGEKIE